MKIKSTVKNIKNHSIEHINNNNFVQRHRMYVLYNNSLTSTNFYLQYMSNNYQLTNKLLNHILFFIELNEKMEGPEKCLYGS